MQMHTERSYGGQWLQNQALDTIVFLMHLFYPPLEPVGATVSPRVSSIQLELNPVLPGVF